MFLIGISDKSIKTLKTRDTFESRYFIISKSFSCHRILALHFFSGKVFSITDFELCTVYYYGREMGVIETLTQFSQETSVHGLAYVGRTSLSKRKRWAWVGFFIASLVYAFVQIKYLSNGMSTGFSTYIMNCTCTSSGRSVI